MFIICPNFILTGGGATAHLSHRTPVASMIYGAVYLKCYNNCHVLFLILVFLVSALSEKYGKGEKSTLKCQSCSYEQEIYSSGVHATEGGSLMVYDTADEFSCPNCYANDTLMEAKEIVEKPGKISSFA